MDRRYCNKCEDMGSDCPIDFDGREICIARHSNSIRPDACPKCNKELNSSPGFVGEEVLWCKDYGVVWKDAAGAIARVV